MSHDGERSERISEEDDGAATATVHFIVMQGSRGAEAGHFDTTPHPRSQGQMYTLIHKVMKIKTVKPEKAAAIENSVIKAAQSGMLKNQLTEK